MGRRADEFQDLLHLQRTDDGDYFRRVVSQAARRSCTDVCLTGRKANNQGVGPFGTDYCFVSPRRSTASGEGVRLYWHGWFRSGPYRWTCDGTRFRR